MKLDYDHYSKNVNYPIQVMLLSYKALTRKLHILKKELEIIGFHKGVLLEMMIPIEFKQNVKNFRIDLYFPDPKIAIEIDEHITFRQTSEI